jgi:hypothetical protein
MEFGLWGVNLSLQPQLKPMKKVSWFAFFLVLTVSCLDDPDCFQLHNNIIGITFRVLGTNQGDSTLLKGFSISGKDTVVLSFGLQLNYFEEEIDLGFSGIAENNFLALGYTVKNQFVSEDCGSRFVLSDLRVLEHDFDSVHIINSNPTKTAGPNIDIYRCPKTDTLTINFSQLLATSNGITVSARTSKFLSHPFEKVTADFAGEVYSGRGTTLHLPVNLSASTTMFIFSTNESVDTLLVGYDRTTEERYKPCGIQTFVGDLRIIENTFDSISFALDDNEEPIRTLLDPHTANLSVYDCPKMNLLQVVFRTAADAATSVVLNGVTADHLSGNLLKEPSTVSTLNLPVDNNSDVSNFYIQYEDRTDTLSVQYSRSPIVLFRACESQMVIGNLAERIDLDNAEILGTSLQFPAIPNVKITVN